jgi:hypothetical protein
MRRGMVLEPVLFDELAATAFVLAAAVERVWTIVVGCRNVNPAVNYSIKKDMKRKRRDEGREIDKEVRFSPRVAYVHLSNPSRRRVLRG